MYIIPALPIRKTMFDKLREIGRGIREREEKRRAVAASIRAEPAGEFEGAYERELAKGIEQKEINGKVCASDAGLASLGMHGVDFLASRAVGVMFEYENSRLKSHKYHPSPVPQLSFGYKEGLELHDASYSKSLFRLKSELFVSIESIRKFSPDFFLLDGSIAPLVSDKPAEDSPIKEDYFEVVSLYQEIYETCAKENCTLVGVIKDSRGKRFLEIMQKRFEESSLRSSNDSSFLHYLLNEGERTFAFAYSSSPSRHQVLKDLGVWSDKICTFYLKPAAMDRPLRCEFLSGKKSFDEVASFIYSLSRINKKYAYPAILIEADLRAAFSPQEYERIQKDLAVSAGFSSSTMELRRNMRPFR